MIWLLTASFISKIGPFCYFQPNDGVLHLHLHLFGPHIKSSYEQLPNANSTTPELLYHVFVKQVITAQETEKGNCLFTFEPVKMEVQHNKMRFPKWLMYFYKMP